MNRLDAIHTVSPICENFPADLRTSIRDAVESGRSLVVPGVVWLAVSLRLASGVLALGELEARYGDFVPDGCLEVRDTRGALVYFFLAPCSPIQGRINLATGLALFGESEPIHARGKVHGTLLLVLPEFLRFEAIRSPV